MLNRRSFLGALAGLPVLGHIMQRAPLPSDPVVVVNAPYSSTGDLTPTVRLTNISTTTYPEWAAYGTDGPRLEREHVQRMIAALDYRRDDGALVNHTFG